MFLHKDYLGSILAVSDKDGYKVQEAYFDAWGNRQTGGDINYLDRGYTGHEHFEDIGIIHMNGRLYDPLLRRFLNADGNIQDPNNTQNYNKYGYVLNNPLMYNDPSGEFFFLPFLIGIGLGQFFAGVLSAIIVGAAIGAAMYAVQAAISGNWSWGAFGMSILVGAITTVATAGLGNVFSTSGFWAAVGNGAVAGGISGGISSIINGTDFLQGIITGAVIGGIVAGISYTVNYYARGYNKTQYTRADDIIYNDSGNSRSVEYSDSGVSEFRKKFFKPEEIRKYRIGKEYAGGKLFKINPKTGLFVDAIDGTEFYAAANQNFLTGKTDIFYSKNLFSSDVNLLKTMAHETVHAFVNTPAGAAYSFLLRNGVTEGMTYEHLGIRIAEWDFFWLNPGFKPDGRLFTNFNRLYLAEMALPQFVRPTYDRFMKDILPIFNRKLK